MMVRRPFLGVAWLLSLVAAAAVSNSVYSSDGAVTIRPGGPARTAAPQQADQTEGIITIAAATQAAALPQITVQARRELERRIKGFVATVIGPMYSSDAVELWRAPICPALMGLPRSEGEHFFAHMEATMRALGISLGQIGCKPNFLIVVTLQPEDLINRIATRWPGVFGGSGAGLEAFIHTPRAVRIWHNADLVDSYGAPASTVYLMDSGGGSNSGPHSNSTVGVSTTTVGVPAVGVMGLGTTAPRFQYSLVRTFFNGVAIVDRTRVVGFDWNQVADYVVMAGLTQVNSEADFGDAPTILRLFTVPEKDRLVGLSDWDRALLKELYKTDPVWRSQRFDVSARMTRDIAP